MGKKKNPTCLVYSVSGFSVSSAFGSASPTQQAFCMSTEVQKAEIWSHQEIEPAGPGCSDQGQCC